MEAYTIIDLDGFAEILRESAAKDICDQYTENLDDFISLNQVKIILDQHSLGIDDNGQYVITEEVYHEMLNDIQRQIYEIGLAKLAAEDKIECAWDEETNDMVFWAKQKLQ
jgi:hypothetical protein